MFATTMPVIVRIPPITVRGSPHDGVQPVWMKIMAEVKASMLEASVTNCGVNFLFVCMCMVMLNQARIVVAWAIRLVVTKVDVDVKNPADSVNAEGRLSGR